MEGGVSYRVSGEMPDKEADTWMQPCETASEALKLLRKLRKEGYRNVQVAEGPTDQLRDEADLKRAADAEDD